MAANNNSILSVFKLSLGRMINQTDYLTTQYQDSDIETMIDEGLIQAAIYAEESMKFLRGDDGVNGINIVADTGSLPSDYLWHDKNKTLICVNNGTEEEIFYTDDERKFRFGPGSDNIDTSNYYRIFGRTIKVHAGANGSAIDEVHFPYIKIPTSLTETPITDEFRQDVYNHLLHFVIGKLYMFDIADDDQKKMALSHFMKFYSLIQAPKPEELAKVQAAA